MAVSGTELEVLKHMGERGGVATIWTVAGKIAMGSDYARIVCNSLGRADYIDVYASGKCEVTPKGWQELKKEAVNRVMEELGPVSRDIVAYLWRSRYATINELADLVAAPSHMEVLLKIRDTINPVAERIVGNPLLVFERSKIDPTTGEKVLFSWWMLAPEEAGHREKEALLISSMRETI